MSMLGCLFCKRKRRLFKISVVYDGTGCPIKDYIIEFLGPCGQYLREDHGMCSWCVILLNKLLYIRKCMNLIVAVGRDDEDDIPAFKFSYIYNHFIENLQKLNYEESEPEYDQNALEFLQPIHVSPWDEEREAEHNANYDYYYRYGTPHVDREIQTVFGRGKRKDRGQGRGARSKSSLTTYNFENNNRGGTPHVDKEVEDVFNKRHRGRGRSRGRSRGSNSKSRLSTYSEPVRRTNRVRSVTNFSEYFISDSDEDNGYTPSSLLYGRKRKNGILKNKCIRLGYKCISGCSFKCDELAKLTKHKEDNHGMLANYVCYECHAQKFASREDLKLHNDLLHHTLISNCCICSMELRSVEDLQKHLNQHKMFSYPCKYCDMAFLKRKDLKAHVVERHKERKKRKRNLARCHIIDRFHRLDETTSANICENDDSKYNGQIIWRLQKRPANPLNSNGKELSIEIPDNVDHNCSSIQSEGNVAELSENVTITNNYDENRESLQSNYNEVLENSEETVPNIASETDIYVTEDMESADVDLEEINCNNVVL